MTKHKIEQMDILQRKILRRIIGWRRIEDESWKGTMERMNLRMGNARKLYDCKDWSIVFAQAQWRYVSHITDGPISMWSRILIPGIRLEDALLSAEVAIEYANEWTLPSWVMSMDMRKAFDTVEYLSLIHI